MWNMLNMFKVNKADTGILSTDIFLVFLLLAVNRLLYFVNVEQFTVGWLVRRVTAFISFSIGYKHPLKDILENSYYDHSKLMIKAFLHQQPHASKTAMEESRFNSNWCSMSSGNKRSYLFKQVHSFSSRLFWVCMPSITTTIKGLEFIPWQVYITLILPLNLSTLYADLEVLLTNPILITIF